MPVLAPVGNSQDRSQREVLNFPGYTFSHYTLDEARIFVHGGVARVVGPAGSSASSPPDLPTHRPVSAAASSLLCIDVTLRPTQRKSLSPLLSPSLIQISALGSLLESLLQLPRLTPTEQKKLRPAHCARKPPCDPGSVALGAPLLPGSTSDGPSGHSAHSHGRAFALPVSSARTLFLQKHVVHRSVCAALHT